MSFMGLARKDLVIVAVLLSGTLLAVLNQTLLSPALPAIMSGLQVDATTVQWLTSGYSLVEAVVIPLSAFLIGRFTTRQLFITGLSLFTAGSFLAAIAPHFSVLLLGRVLQAACTGMVMPMVMTVILLVIPREKRGQAMGVIGLIIGFAPAVGPSVAGLLVDSVGWRALFVIVTVLSVAVLLLSVKVLKNYGSFERSKFDAVSVALSSVGLVCLLYGLSTFSSGDNLVVTGVLVAVGIVVTGLYVRRQFKLPEPMLKIDILKTRKYATTVVIVVLIQVSLMGTGVITPLYIQGVRGYSATASGVAMLPGALIGAALGLVAGRLFDRYGVRRVAIPGFAVTIVGAAGLVALGIDTDIVVISLVYTVLTAGLQFAMTPINTWGLNSLDNRVLQHAQGLSNTLNQVAASFGTALLVSISAFGPAVAPGAEPQVQAYAGYHLAFCTTAILLAVAFLVILVFVRGDKKQASAPQVTQVAEGASTWETAHVGHVKSTVAWRGGAAEVGYKDLTVRHAMTTDPAYVTVDATMRDVVRLLAATETSGVPVIDASRRVVGFVSDGDVASYLGRNESSLFDATLNLYRFADEDEPQIRLARMLDLSVMDMATRHVIAVEADDSLDEACHMLASKRIKKVPVVEGGVLVGSLSRRNIVQAVAAGL